MPRRRKVSKLRPLQLLHGDELREEVLGILAGRGPHLLGDDPLAPAEYLYMTIQHGSADFRGGLIELLEDLYLGQIGSHLHSLQRHALNAAHAPGSAEAAALRFESVFILAQYFHLMYRLSSVRSAHRAFIALLELETFIQLELGGSLPYDGEFDLLLGRMRACASAAAADGMPPIDATLIAYYQRSDRAIVALAFFIGRPLDELRGALLRAVAVFVRATAVEQQQSLDTLGRALENYIERVSGTTQDALRALMKDVSGDWLDRAEAAFLIARAIVRRVDWSGGPKLAHELLTWFFHELAPADKLDRTPAIRALRNHVRFERWPLGLGGQANEVLEIFTTEFTETAALVVFGLALCAQQEQLRVEFPRAPSWDRTKRDIASKPAALALTNPAVGVTDSRQRQLVRSVPVFEFDTYVLFARKEYVSRTIEQLSDPQQQKLLEKMLEGGLKFGGAEWAALDGADNDAISRGVRELIRNARIGILANSDLEVGATHLIRAMTKIEDWRLSPEEGKGPPGRQLVELLDNKLDLFLAGANHTYYLNEVHYKTVVQLNEREAYRTLTCAPSVDYFVAEEGRRAAAVLSELESAWFTAMGILKEILEMGPQTDEQRQLLAYLLHWTNRYTYAYCDARGLRTILTEWDHFYTSEEQAESQGKEAYEAYFKDALGPLGIHGREEPVRVQRADG